MNLHTIMLNAGLFFVLTSGISGMAAAQAPRRYDHGEPTAFEQLLLELINRARANPGAEASRLGLSNLNKDLPAGTIVNSPKPPLTFHPSVIRASRDHSQWMLDAQKFQHPGPDADRSDGKKRMERAGYVFSGNWGWAENLAWKSSGGAVDVKALTIEAHRGLFLSAGHRKNLCNALFDDAGIGILTGNFQGNDAVMITGKFAASAWTPGPLVTGVVYIDANTNGFYDPGEGVSGVRVKPGNGDWFAVTSGSGGYAVPYPAGSGAFNVAFSGSILRRPLTLSMSPAGMNVKLDLTPVEQQIERPAHFVDGSLAMSADGGFSAEVSGMPGARFSVEHSGDLRRWTKVGDYTLAQNTAPFLHRPVSRDCGFYRVRR